MSHRTTAALLCAVAVATPLSAQSVSYAQGDFVASQWAFTNVSLIGPVSGTEQLAATGGNTGNNWLHAFALSSHMGSTRYRVVNINNTFTYDPRVSGALASLTFSFDLLGVATSGFSVPFFGNYVPTLRQDGQVFIRDGGVQRPTTLWATYGNSSATFMDWVDPNDQTGPRRPDFSATGTTMEFGYLLSGGSDCPSGVVCGSGSFTSRLDNFAVTATTVSTVSTVPEPSTYALLATGLGALLLAHRRRRPLA